MQKKTPEDYVNKIIESHRFINSARKMIDYEVGQIIYMDEVPLILDVVANRTVYIKVSKIINLKPIRLRYYRVASSFPE